MTFYSDLFNAFSEHSIETTNEREKVINRHMIK